MALSDLAQRIYLEARRENLLKLQVVAYHQAVTARNQAADLVRLRAQSTEVEQLRQAALGAQARCEQFTRAIKAIEAELREDREW